MRMDWSKMMRDAGIEESPGRVEASKMRRFEATFREKSGWEHVEIIDAMSYHGALKKLKGRSKTLYSLEKLDQVS
jgi:hypothetical protein